MIDPGLLLLLRCPDCGGTLAGSGLSALECRACTRRYAVLEGGIPSLLPTTPKPLPPDYEDPDYQRMIAVFDDASSYFTDGNAAFSAIHNSSHRTIAAWQSRAPAAGWTCDVGCGQGYHWPHFAGAQGRLVGIDIRADSLQRIRGRYPDARLVQADATRLPFSDGTFERVLSVYALEHVYHLNDAVAEIRRITSASGQALVGLPCEGGLAWTLGRKVTSERTMSRRYGLDYRRYIRLAHCNTAQAVLTALDRHFRVEQRTHFPLPFIPGLTFNLTVSLALTPRPGTPA